MGADGARRYVPAIAITNNSASSIDVVLEFGRDGQPLLLPFKDSNGRIVRYAGASGTVEPGNEVSPMLADIVETVRYGYLRVTSEAPESLAVKSFTTAIESTRFGVFSHPAVFSSPLTHQVGIENSPRTKQTILSIVNPTDEPVHLSLTPRRFDGRDACAPVMIELAPGAQIWRSAQSLISCVRSGEDNYNLYIEPLDGEIAVQAYYDYGSLVFANAPVHQLEPTPVAEDMAKNPAQAKAAVTATCVPTFDPLKPRLTSDEQTLEIDINFGDCNPDQTWVIQSLFLLVLLRRLAQP